MQARALVEAIEAARHRRGLTLQQVAQEARVGASTLTRFRQGGRPRAETVRALAAWAGLPDTETAAFRVAAAYKDGDGLRRLPARGNEESFDIPGFAAALDQRRRDQTLNWRQVAAQAGVSTSVLSRLLQGHRPRIDTIASLASWGRLSVDRYVTAPPRAGDAPD